jgi:hypothetical protein
LEGIEGDIKKVEQWIAEGGRDFDEGDRKDAIVGQWRDESAKSVTRNLRPEMFI